MLPRLPAGATWIAVHTGESGDRVYRSSDGAAYAKLATAARVAALDGERRRIAWLAPCGLGTARVLDWITAPGTACLITSTVPGVPASDLPAADLIRAWPSIAQRLKALHTLPIADCPFERGLETMMTRAADVVARDAVNPDFLDPQLRDIPAPALLARLRAQLPGRLAQEQRDRVVCHGDACLPNLMVDPATLRCVGFVDLGRLGTADRHADLALLLANARETWASPDQARTAHASLFAALDIAPDPERLAFYLHLDPLTWG
ncbi:MAG TPA: APH(3'') family aminoglycoside O-phosphotransferase [Vineibacter terrae]|nr:APH(3'') family aminoglycoside O-phosphotransferase [Vineibacter terrae]HEX2890675.1 APH(3'') family aminoglycoside O-phosphotransferase [Vineibacter terrae]